MGWSRIGNETLKKAQSVVCMTHSQGHANDESDGATGPPTHGGGRDAPYMIVDRSTCLMYAFNVPIWPMLASMHSGTVVPVLIVNIDDIMAILANF